MKSYAENSQNERADPIIYTIINLNEVTLLINEALLYTPLAV